MEKLNNNTQFDIGFAPVGFFEEKPNVKSSMRLFSFIALCAAVMMAFYCVATKQVNAYTISLISMFIVGAFTPKAIQKFAEVRTNKHREI